MNIQSTHIAADLDLSMAPEPSSAVLARNLAVLRATDPELAERIAAAPDRPLAIQTAEDGHPTAEWQGRRLASARRPGEEAARILDGIELRSAGLVAVAGFGLGQHVAALSRRLGKAGIVVVLEPDLELLRAVFSRIEASGWLTTGNVRIVSEPSSSAIASRVRGLEPLIMVGIRLVEHPPSRPRLATVLSDFVAVVRNLATNARINLVTTLVRCAETLENQLGNLPAYATASGIEDLRDVAKGRLGVVVSAGPSLRRNMELLARPGVRDRCVIVATQTTLRPLLAAGIAPHFVTAIDYHAISKRFYDGITSAMVRDTELVVDSKVNPAVIDAWPGRVRTIPSTELDRVLGPLARGVTPLASPATVAHLCYSLARHMGCDPVALIGQDLGFTDGLYYAPGNAIHDVWTPEFNAFNTVETMEWERIVRHRAILSAREDVHGRRMFTDVQMLTYLQTFEVMFADDARRGLVTIDATEGGVRKERTEIGTLQETLAVHAGPESAPIDLPRASEPDGDVIARTVDRVASLLADVREIAIASDEAASILGRMRDDQKDRRRMDSHFEGLDAVRERVEARAEARALTDIVNQIGVYKRLRADRLISIERDLEPMERQRLELDRDVVNVEWTGEAARLLEDMLERSIEHLRTGRRRESGRSLADLERSAGLAAERGDARRIFAVVPLDPDHGGTGVERRLDAPFAGGRLLDRVLQRLGRSKELTGIILLAADDLEVESLCDREAVDLPIVVHRCGEWVFPPAHDTVRSARASAPTSWRGGIQGLGVWDEVLAPAPTVQALDAVEGDAAILVGPDWPFIPVRGDHGIDATIRRWQDRPELPFVFTQAPPGLGAFLAPRALFESFAGVPTRRSSIGHLLGYRSENPLGDPVATESCIVPPASVRNGIGRFIIDSPRQRMRIRRSLEDSIESPGGEPGTVELVRRLESRMFGLPLLPPQFIRIELCTGRVSVPRSMPFAGEIQRPPMNEAMFRRIVDELAESRDAVVVFDGLGDPLLHPRFDDFARIAIDAGVRQVRVRTDLVVDADIVDRLLAAPIEVVEVDLDAESSETYRRMHGTDAYDRVAANLERLIAGRRLLDPATPIPAEVPSELRPGLPWIVPRMERRAQSIGEQPEFFERWRRRLGSAVVDGPIRWPLELVGETDPLSETRPPHRADRLVATTRLTILADGGIPVSETDPMAQDLVGRVGERPLRELWREVVERRREFEVDTGAPVAPMRA